MKKNIINRLIGKKRKGSYLVFIIIMSSVLMIFATAIISIAISNLNLARSHERAVSSVQVAEAGINYYLWHLSHNNTDYCDGQTCSGSAPFGPYTHNFTAPDGEIMGSYTLNITPPTQGDSIVSIKSTGKAKNGNTTRTIIAEIGMPSFAKYSFLTNTECWFGDSESTNGPVHSNVGVHFDGTANGIISSSSQTYVPSSSFGGDGHTTHNGVWGNGGPQSYWIFPVPSVNFNQVSVDLSKLATSASSNGISLGSSNKLGYYLKLNTNNTINIYKVTSENSNGIATTFYKTVNAPNNGILYANDYLWVDGNWNNKITIATPAQAANKSSITITNNLTYHIKDGTNKIGLVAKGDIKVAPYAPNTIEIDAAMLSQSGHVWYENGGPIKDNISVYGSISTFDYWTWTWVDGNNHTTSGYKNTNQTYDPFLTLGPPPEFPTTGSYNVLSWREE